MISRDFRGHIYVRRMEKGGDQCLKCDDIMPALTNERRSRLDSNAEKYEYLELWRATLTQQDLCLYSSIFAISLLVKYLVKHVMKSQPVE